MKLISRNYVLLKGLLFVLTMFIPFELVAQVGMPSPVRTKNTPQPWNFAVSYNQNNNIYYWRGKAAFARTVGKGYLTITNTFDVSRIKIPLFDDKWKDINRFSAQYSLRMYEAVRPVVNVSSHYLSDLQTGFLNKIQENSLDVQIPISINNSIVLSPSFGYKADKRIDKTDKGPQFGVNLIVLEQKVGDYTTEAQAQYFSENLSVRKNRNHSVSFSVFRQFSKEAADTLTYHNSSQRRDYYVSIAGNLETRKEQVQTVTNTLNYAITKTAQVRVNTEIIAGDVDISSISGGAGVAQRSRDDRNIMVDIAVLASRLKHRSMLNLRLQNVQQRYKTDRDEEIVFGSVPFSLPDNDVKKIALGLEAEGAGWRNSSFMLESYVEKLQYNTPSQSNFDDRDELRYRVQGTYAFNINPNTLVSFESLASLNHLIYIFQQRSADNNWNRIFQTGSTITYRSPSGFRLASTFSVLANYVDYDFENTFIRIRSFVFRRYSMNHAFEFPVTRHGEIEASFQLNLEENGLLRWKDFVQNILIDRTIVSGMLNYAYHVTPAFTLKPGIQFFSRKETHHQVKVLNEFQKRFSKINDTGISLAINYQINETSLISLGASKRFVTQGSSNREFQFVDLSVDWLF